MDSTTPRGLDTPDLAYSATYPLLPDKTEQGQTVNCISRPPSSIFKVEPSGRKEPSKVAVSRGLPWPELLTHIVGLGVTITIVWINYRKLYSTKLETILMSNEDVSLNMWQVASKAHELVLVSSLSFIALHYMREYLLGPQGLPFGLLGAPYICGTVSMMFQVPFWFHGVRKLRYAPYATLLLIICILSLFLGPFSAMAMIPRRGWYVVDTPFQDQSGVIYTTNQNQWRTTLNETKTYGGTCNDVSPLLYIEGPCPGVGLSEIMFWWQGHISNGAEAGIVFEDTYSDAQRHLSIGTLERVADFQFGTVSTAITKTILLGAGGLWSYVRENIPSLASINSPEFRIAPETAIYQPIVHVECNTQIWDQNQTTPNITFPTAEIGWNDVSQDPFVLNVESDTWGQWRNFSKRRFSWIRDDRTGNNTSSILALTGLPISERNLYPNPPQYALVPCSIDARWVAANVYYQPRNSTKVSSNVTDNLGELHSRKIGKTGTAEDFRRRYGMSDKPIDIQTDFAKWITNVSIYDHSPDWVSGDVLLSELPIFGPDGYASKFNLSLKASESPIAARDAFFAESISKLMSVLITNGLTAPGLLETVMLDTSTNRSEASLINLRETRSALYLEQGIQISPEEHENMTYLNNEAFKFRFNVRQHGYGWQIDSTSTKVAVCFLLIYCALVTLHFVSIILLWSFGRYKYCSAWGDISALVALAFNSTPDDKLKGTGAGIKKNSTWASLVNVRAVHDDTLEMKLTAVNARSGWEHEKVKIDVKYD
ncbi:hypothetical protein EJ05DRAFT_156429 [Pseudovirgaria hyperparasitica]|uniref:Uncharacterized protein n=1 Tax=Pseudovirgaria hyperparasitica TaxID=470096 RepID=A0A6A6VVS2_9PEZI|nr:uncharacterized protein EJ05DRAFT_156429 [Pseudovirgaria hyperparasitica]KAF2754333.1 hypothetical protein EJ05DRAFT_156429 [Pseudovirgaria hyperparasitica]